MATVAAHEGGGADGFAAVDGQFGVGGAAAGADLDGVVPGDDEPARGPGGLAEPPTAGQVERVDNAPGLAARLQVEQGDPGRDADDVGGQVLPGEGLDAAADQAGVEVPGTHVRLGEQRPQEPDVGAEPEQYGLGQGGVERAQRLGAVGPVRVVLRPHCV